MSRKGQIFKKLHKWPGLIMAFLLIFFGASGIVLNHRAQFSNININRNILPSEYRHSNWNNGALKGNVDIGNGKQLIYGNIGVWLTDSTFSKFSDFNNGFGSGDDNRKISDLEYTKNGSLYASTIFGLFTYNFTENKWIKLNTEELNERFVGLESVGDTVYAMSRSLMYYGLAQGPETKLEAKQILAPIGYTKKVSLFETIWQIHSGEMFGLAGKLIVDLLGIITIALSITGVIYFFFPSWIKRRRKAKKTYSNLAKTNRWSLKWHNKLGAWTFVLLCICYGTGMFLRPPLLISIAGKKINPIKYSKLDSNNPWHDKLRDLIYNEEENSIIISTSEGMYWVNRDNLSAEKCAHQPLVSVMGINCFQQFHGSTYMIGSFSGLFLWNPNMPKIVDFITGSQKVGNSNSSGRPVGFFKVTGLILDSENYPYAIDYSNGIMPLHHNKPFADMPSEIIAESTMSLWNFALEIHTMRIFGALIGELYMLLIPLSGILGIIVVLSGYLYYRKRYRKT